MADQYSDISTPDQFSEFSNHINNSLKGGKDCCSTEMGTLADEKRSREKRGLVGGKKKKASKKASKKSSKKASKKSSKKSSKKAAKKSSKQMERPKKASKKSSKKSSKKASKKSSKKSSKKTQSRGANPSFDAMIALKKHIGDKVGNHSVVVMKVVTAYTKKVKGNIDDKVKVYAEAKKIFDADTPSNWKKELDQAQKEMNEKKALKKANK